MDRDAIRAWKRGHEMAEARSIELARAVAPSERLAQAWRLARSARDLGWTTRDDAELEGVRRRFAKLRAHLGVVP